ncbi:hypothetical protein ABZ590_02340 [Streptomyces hirsutus]|uniref:hypothetical protein n=1 Tax=Streptomyces hirsutus TaxID=35620 RepID=UPI00340F4739
MSRSSDGSTGSSRRSADRLVALDTGPGEALRRHETLKETVAAPGRPVHPRRSGSGKRSIEGIPYRAAGRTAG